MAKQFLTVRKNEPIVIETPEGFIKISWDRGRKFILDLPGQMKAFIGQARAESSGRFTRIEGGKVLPTYKVLTPKVVEGELVGVNTPPLVSVGAK